MHKKILSFILIALLTGYVILTPFQITYAESKTRIYSLEKIKNINWTDRKMTFYGNLKGKNIIYKKKKTFKLAKNYKCRVADPELGWYSVPEKEFRQHIFVNGKNGEINYGIGYTIKVKNKKIIAICYAP